MSSERFHFVVHQVIVGAKDLLLPLSLSRRDLKPKTWSFNFWIFGLGKAPYRSYGFFRVIVSTTALSRVVRLQRGLVL